MKRGFGARKKKEKRKWRGGGKDFSAFLKLLNK